MNSLEQSTRRVWRAVVAFSARSAVVWALLCALGCQSSTERTRTDPRCALLEASDLLGCWRRLERNGCPTVRADGELFVMIAQEAVEAERGARCTVAGTSVVVLPDSRDRVAPEWVLSVGVRPSGRAWHAVQTVVVGNPAGPRKNAAGFCGFCFAAVQPNDGGWSAVPVDDDDIAKVWDFR